MLQLSWSGKGGTTDHLSPKSFNFPQLVNIFPRSQIVMEMFRLWNSSVSKWIQDEAGVTMDGSTYSG